MRPSLDIDPGLLVPPSQRPGTGRHTLPDGPLALDCMAEEFFSAGDTGSYAGGPDLAELDGVDEPELAPVKLVVRTPEMDARRARGVRVVASVVGCLAALLAFGVVRANASERPGPSTPTAGIALAPGGAGATPAAEHFVPPAPEAAPLPKPATQAKNAGSPPSAAAAEKPPVSAPLPRSVAAPRASAKTSAAPVTAPAPARALPNVANFAARAGEAPQATGKVPTASFAPSP